MSMGNPFTWPSNPHAAKAGAPAAAEASGNRKAAADYYKKLQALAADRDAERPELTQAKGYLARQ